jgi:hypothetical protein
MSARARSLRSSASAAAAFKAQLQDIVSVANAVSIGLLTVVSVTIPGEVSDPGLDWAKEEKYRHSRVLKTSSWHILAFSSSPDGNRGHGRDGARLPSLAFKSKA